MVVIEAAKGEKETKRKSRKRGLKLFNWEFAGVGGERCFGGLLRRLGSGDPCVVLAVALDP